ncbi:MAG: Rnf-Nqr domain containing protein [Pseudomonadales bacterium]|nr:Rnf-Nqr domain containing protein [Pseudomonadales bacterium]
MRSGGTSCFLEPIRGEQLRRETQWLPRQRLTQSLRWPHRGALRGPRRPAARADTPVPRSDLTPAPSANSAQSAHGPGASGRGRATSAYTEFVKGIWKENPVFVQVLGMCPMLAVTNSAINALAMGAATAFVLLGSSTLIWLLRKAIPKQVRISTYIIGIATFVTLVDFALQAPVSGVN